MINQKKRFYLLSITVTLCCLLACFSHKAGKYTDLYPFFDWRLMPFPSYYNPKVHYRLYYQNTENWQRLSIQDKNYAPTLMANLQLLKSNKINKADFGRRFIDYIPSEAKRFKVVKESYLPLKVIQNKHEFKREDLLLFDRGTILGN